MARKVSRERHHWCGDDNLTPSLFPNTVAQKAAVARAKQATEALKQKEKQATETKEFLKELKKTAEEKNNTVRPAQKQLSKDIDVRLALLCLVIAILVALFCYNSYSS